jgi:hypothetical protein
VGPACRFTFLTNSTFSPPSQPRAAAAHRSRVREGGNGRTAGLARTPSPHDAVAHPKEGICWEKTHVPLPVLLQARWRPLRAGHVAEPM